MLVILLFSVISLVFEPCLCKTMLVDGVSEWKDPTVHVGDTIVFRHKYGYDLYIFQNKDAFSVCNFTQATVLTKPNSKNFTWYPSRTGFFYFGFSNATLATTSTSTCPPSLHKLPIQVLTAPSPASPSPQPTSSPAPTSRGAVSSSPSYPWPEGPREGASSAAGPAPSGSTTVTVPDKGVPFINSNPAVPLPTGEVDSVTINPLATNSGNPQKDGRFFATVRFR